MSPSQLALLPARPKGLFPDDALKRQFSETLMRAMATSLNVRCVVHSEDIDSVDVEFDSGRFGPLGVPLGINRKLEAQLKCTTASSLKSMLRPGDDVPSLRYYLAVKDYNRLAISADNRPYPHVLVVVRVPPEPADWIHHQGHLTLLRAKAWWLDLTDAPPASHPQREPVYLPISQVFNLQALDSLMQEPQ